MSARMVLLKVTLATLILSPLAHASESRPPAPLVAFAADVGGSAIVGWAPSLEGADYYRVYGVREGALAPLETVHDGNIATVPGDYAAYAVTAVARGVESTPVFATVAGPCVGVGTNPPGVIVGCLGIPTKLVITLP